MNIDKTLVKSILYDRPGISPHTMDILKNKYQGQKWFDLLLLNEVETYNNRFHLKGKTKYRC